MKWIRPNTAEWVSFFVVMPILAAVLNTLLYEDRIWTDRRVWLYSYPLIILQGLVSWYAHIVVMYWLRHRFPHISQTTKRLVLLAASHVGMTTFTFISLFFAYDALHFLGYRFNPDGFQTSLLVVLALTMITDTFWEAEYTFRLWKNSLAEKEKLQLLSLQHEFDTLKSQVNPHFLFNCFNTLSSLISEDRKAAETFLNELSKVYRYLLKNNSDGLSTLDNELKFIQSFYRLLRTRYGDALMLNLDIDKRYLKYILPSCSLQLLVENAVKHNVVSRQSPLVIDIFTTAGNLLVVSNNRQPKQLKVMSHRIGLENIRSKYELVRQQGFQIMEDERNFSVVLPLIWSPVLDSRITAINEHPFIKPSNEINI